MFAAVMADTEQCRKLLEIALDMDILEVQAAPEKNLAYHPDYHGVRLDVMAIEAGTRRRFNVEMQVRTEKGLPRRSRYYHAQMDMEALLAGEVYEELPDTYVIFICDFDPFGDALYRYTFNNICRENGKALEDGRITVFLSTKGKNIQEVPGGLVSFLNYVGYPEKAGEDEADAFVAGLKAQIEAIKRNREWEARFMLLEEMMRDERAEGREEGREEGRKRVSRLIELLAEQGRMDDIVKIAKDEAYQNELLRKFGL